MNRLAAETSPYLRQHAHNPVDWYPWGDEAFDRARAEDRPVFLSVGYSACHWCHVMAHESFEDGPTAQELNAGFVSVKVDREERPDVDAVYMEAVQATTGRGGWPMTVFLMPDGRPFFAGTYFPVRDGHGMPGFRRVLGAVDDAWRNRRRDVERQADALAEAIARRVQLPADLAPAVGGVPADLGASSSRLLDAAVAELRARFDPAWGGFGPAPKFPQPQLVELCLRHHHATGDESSLAMATTTLGAMAAGGIYDHLGGGFARYATDTSWTVPHFEKMLYDQAGLVRAYLHAWQVTKGARWLQVVEETVGYVLGTLAAPGGGLYCAEDADSEGEEGRFYVWTPAEVVGVLGPELAEVATEWYGISDAGNFEGRTILRRPTSGDLRRPPQVEEARRRLAEARALRVRPGLDDKVLTEWNAMFAAALAEAAAAAARPDWAAAAVGVGEFLLAELRRPGDGRWLRSWQGGRARHLAYAADYAWVVDLFTRLAELTGQPRWLDHGREAATAMLSLFAGDDGLLFTTGHDAEALVVRPLDLLDGAVPAANSVAVTALLRLGALTGDDALGEAGETILRSLWRVAAEHPLAAANTVAGGALASGGVTEVVVAGERPDLVAAARRRFEPTMVLAWGEPTASPLWAGREPGHAYVCRRYACRAPADSPEELGERLDEELAAALARVGAGAGTRP
ncbi:MAG TPA: thioredoxin domain-containing protein [Acidimicrobiales bacterium]|nr:thioredoxin domain-containing protein [Acidimicrobiales bacterium]